MGVGKRGLAPLDFKNFSKKGCFLGLEWEKNFYHFWSPPKKILEKPLIASPCKNPCDAHGDLQ